MIHQVREQLQGYVRAELAMNIQEFEILSSAENPSMNILRIQTVDGVLLLAMKKETGLKLGATILHTSKNMMDLS